MNLMLALAFLLSLSTLSLSAATPEEVVWYYDVMP
jgi:hypothetical protein